MTPLGRWMALALAHAVGLVGAIVLALHTFRYDALPIEVAGAIGLSALGIGAAFVAAGRQLPEAWLVVGGVWLYDAVIAGLREPTIARNWGYGLVFGGYFIGAIATYLSTEWRTS